MMQKPLSCAIIGAGSIGGLIDNPQSPNIASHAHALSRHSLCEITAIVEPNEQNKQEFIKRWGKVKVYKDFESLLTHETIDLLIIASPTPFHATSLDKALHAKSIKTILCEKPLVSNHTQLKHLQNLLLSSDKKILINLMREFDPSFMLLAEKIKNGFFGKALHFQGIFTKGLLHNGIHMLGVLGQFFGDITQIKPLHVKESNNDLSGDFELTCKDTKGLLHCLENPPYSAFELSIWFENGKVEIKEGGSKIEIFKKVASSLYEGYFSLIHQETLPNTLNHYALNSLEFALENDDIVCKKILQRQMNLHEKIFETINKESL